MHAVITLSCVALLLFGQTEAFSCKVGLSGLATTVQCKNGEHKCVVTVSAGVKTFGGCIAENSPLCNSNMACCCSTDGCNDEAFLNKCDGSAGSGGPGGPGGSGGPGGPGGSGGPKGGSGSAGYSIKQNIFILVGLLLVAYKLI